MALIPFREANPQPPPASWVVSGFDVKAALRANGGEFTVDDQTQSTLLAALLQFPGVYRADGTTPGVAPGYGTLAQRPAAAAAGDKAFYFATDDNGGALYQVQSGAWVRMGPKGTELKYADSVSDQTGIGTTAADVTGLAIAFTVADRPVVVEAVLPLIGQVTSTGQPTFFIVDSTGATVYTSGQPPSMAAGALIGCPPIKVRLPAGAGALSLKVTGRTTAGTVTVFSALTRKSYIQACEV